MWVHKYNVYLCIYRVILKIPLSSAYIHHIKYSTYKDICSQCLFKYMIISNRFTLLFVIKKKIYIYLKLSQKVCKVVDFLRQKFLFFLTPTWPQLCSRQRFMNPLFKTLKIITIIFFKKVFLIKFFTERFIII